MLWNSVGPRVHLCRFICRVNEYEWQTLLIEMYMHRKRANRARIYALHQSNCQVHFTAHEYVVYTHILQIVCQGLEFGETKTFYVNVSTIANWRKPDGVFRFFFCLSLIRGSLSTLCRMVVLEAEFKRYRLRMHIICRCHRKSVWLKFRIYTKPNKSFPNEFPSKLFSRNLWLTGHHPLLSSAY